MDLFCSLVEFRDFGVPIKPLHLVFQHVSAASKKLDGLIGELANRLLNVLLFLAQFKIY